MRRVMWVAVFAAGGVFAQSASGQQVVSQGCDTCAQHQQVRTYAALRCGCHHYGGTPGCCRCGPSKCDNAWEGFCDEKARCAQRWRDTFWFLCWGGSHEVIEYQSPTECTEPTAEMTGQPAAEPATQPATPLQAPSTPVVPPQLEQMPEEPAPAAPEPNPPETSTDQTTRWPWIPRFW